MRVFASSPTFLAFSSIPSDLEFFNFCIQNAFELAKIIDFSWRDFESHKNWKKFEWDVTVKSVNIHFYERLPGLLNPLGKIRWVLSQSDCDWWYDSVGFSG
jgi:hypothetical protein